MSKNSKTIRDALALALEGMPNDLRDVLAPNDIRKLLTLWIFDYAKTRGVLLSDRDIKEELEDTIKDLRVSK